MSAAGELNKDELEDVAGEDNEEETKLRPAVLAAIELDAPLGDDRVNPFQHQES